MDRADAVTALALAVGLVLVALVNRALNTLGLDALGTLVWPIGYGTLVLVAWYVWIRPLDLGAGADDADGVWEEEAVDEGE